MKDMRCECGKIVCQSDQEFVIIKCRHCKRFMYVKLDDDMLSAAFYPNFVNKIHNHTYAKHI